MNVKIIKFIIIFLTVAYRKMNCLFEKLHKCNNKMQIHLDLNGNIICTVILFYDINPFISHGPWTHKHLAGLIVEHMDPYAPRKGPLFDN